MKSAVKLVVIKVREKVQEYEATLSSPQKVHEFAKNAIWKVGEPVVEEFWVVLLNVRNKVVGSSMVSRGTINECPVTPRDVLLPAILTGAANVVLLHNHPSGDPTPSEEDKLLTQRVYEASKILGVKMLDHVIIAGDNYFSFRDHETIIL